MATTTMARSQRVSSIERVEAVVAYLLRAGVALSALVICIGLLLLFTHPTTAATDIWEHVSSFSAVFAGVAALEPLAIIDLGVLILIVTPMMRVAAALVVYAMEGDRDYTLISGFVLLVMLLGMFLGKMS